MRDALVELPYDFVGAILVGGTEKLRGGEDYGVPLLDVAGRGCGPRSSSTSRTSRCSARASGCSAASRRSRTGSSTSGPTSASGRPRTCRLHRLRRSRSIGTGKRIGKTAVTGHLARLLSQRRRASSSCRWAAAGPPEPELVQVAPTLDQLLEHLARGRARGLRLPGDGGARRRAHDRLPARAAGGSRATCSRRTCGSGSSSPRSSARTSSSSTGAEPRFRPSRSTAACSSSGRGRTRPRISTRTACSSRTSSC